MIKYLKIAIVSLLLCLLAAVPALAQSPGDCPRRWLDVATAEGTYLGRDCPDTCYVVVQLDDGEKLRLVDSLDESVDLLGQPGGRVRVSYDLVAAWNLEEQYCEDTFIFKTGRPVVKAEAEAEAGDGSEENPRALSPEDCPTEVLMLGEAEGYFMGEACQGDCEVVLHLDDGQELRLYNDADRRVNVAESLGRPGNRVAVIYEEARSWNQFRGLCQIRDRLVSGRLVEKAEEAAGEPDDPRYRSWW